MNYRKRPNSDMKYRNISYFWYGLHKIKKINLCFLSQKIFLMIDRKIHYLLQINFVFKKWCLDRSIRSYSKLADVFFQPIQLRSFLAVSVAVPRVSMHLDQVFLINSYRYWMVFQFCAGALLGLICPQCGLSGFLRNQSFTQGPSFGSFLSTCDLISSDLRLS